MNNNQQNHLNFITDLQRISICLASNDDDNAKIFLNHAKKIYNSQLEEKEDLEFDLSLWQKVSQKGIPKNRIDKLKYADKILTISSMIFLRIMNENKQH